MGSAKRKSSELEARKLALYETSYKLALASLRGYGWRPDDPPRSDEVRRALARSILEKIVSGETDPNRIRKLALENVFLGKRLHGLWSHSGLTATDCSLHRKLCPDLTAVERDRDGRLLEKRGFTGHTGATGFFG